jgi:hypothetical protein
MTHDATAHTGSNSSNRRGITASRCPDSREISIVAQSQATLF